MKKLLLLILIVAMLLCACGDGEPTEFQPGTTATPTTAGSNPTTAPTQPTTAATKPTQAPTQPTTVATQPTEPVETKVLAPDFTVYDEEGNAYKLSDFYGKPIILNFWASWCGPCCAELPYFQETYDKYGDQINFLFINLTDGETETIEAAKVILKKFKLSIPVYYDTDYVTVSEYKISAIPLTIVLDAEGYITITHVGSMTRGSLKKLIAQILPEE